MKRGAVVHRRCDPLAVTGPVSTLTYDEYQRNTSPSYPNFQSEEDLFGSWLSSITGIHINPLNLGATKIDLGQAARTIAAIGSAATGNVIAAGGLLAQNLKNSGLVNTGTPASAGGSGAYQTYNGQLPTFDYVKGTVTLGAQTISLAAYNANPANAFDANLVRGVAAPAASAAPQQLAPVVVTGMPDLSSINPLYLVGGALALVLLLQRGER
jgi:hypothetical protein